MSVMRIGGLASGMDTDQIVKDLMRVERMKVDRLYQQRQTLNWQKEQYRDMINEVRIFRDRYFDILNRDTNLTSASALKKMTVTSTNPEIVTVTAGPDAIVGESTFQVIQSATAAKAAASGVTAGSDTGSRLALTDTMETVSGKLQNGLLTFDENGQFTMTINDVAITIDKTDTLKSALQKISSSEAGVIASYSEFSDTLTITARDTGAGDITIDNGGSFSDAFGFINTSGRDAEFIIDGFAGSHSSNTFTIDGKTYSINKQIDAADSSPEVAIKTAVDADAIYQNIESFVNDYNSMIEKINNKIDEEYFRDFQPLTDEQKDAMSEKDIEKWEEKAQSGLLRRDGALSNMLQKLRQSMYDAVGDLNITQIGIETSKNYRDQGKLVLKNGGNDLKAAIAVNPDKVIDFFAQRSEISYSATLTAADRTQRYEESGLASRISDILNDNIRTTRDNNGNKGILLERAGVEGDITEFDNFYDDRIKVMNEQINRMNELMLSRENQYYRKFTAMETALQKLYSQSDWLMSQLQNNA